MEYPVGAIFGELAMYYQREEAMEAERKKAEKEAEAKAKIRK